jgi:cytochrome c
MLKKSALIALAAATMTLAGGPVQAQAQELAAPTGDPQLGEAQWRQCRSCHMIADPSGEVIQRGGRVGPNLWGIVGQELAVHDDFRYSAELTQLGEQGMIWDEANFVAYVEDPTGFVRAHTEPAMWTVLTSR